MHRGSAERTGRRSRRKRSRGPLDFRGKPLTEKHKKCYNFWLAARTRATACCGSAGATPLVIVVGPNSPWFTTYSRRCSLLFTAIPKLPIAAMIQLKPGLTPSSLNRPRKSSVRMKNRTAKKKNNRLRFPRVFSDAEVAPFDQIDWERRTAEITDDSGKVIFKQENIEVPKSWSALATKIAVSKYFYGDIANGIDPRQGGRETSVRQLVHRVTRTITDWGIADGYFANPEAAQIFYDELTWLS